MQVNMKTSRRDIAPRALRVPGCGHDLAVWDYPGCAPPIVFCHCAGVCGRVWDPVVARLGIENRILAWDACGHGDSDKPRDPQAYNTRAFAEDLLAVADALELSGGLLAVGHSGGAAAVACAEMLRPGRFKRAVLIDAIIAPPEFFAGAKDLAAVSRRRKRVFPSRAAARERLGGKPPMNAWAPEALDAYLAHALTGRSDGSAELKCPPEIEAWIYEHGPSVNLYDRLYALQTQVLAITGTTSYMHGYVLEQCKRLPRATLRVLPDAGHFIPQEKPAQTAVLINDWFSVKNIDGAGA